MTILFHLLQTANSKYIHMLTNLHFELRGFIENLFIHPAWLLSNIYCFFHSRSNSYCLNTIQDYGFTYASFSISKLNWIYAIG